MAKQLQMKASRVTLIYETKLESPVDSIRFCSTVNLLTENCNVL